MNNELNRNEYWFTVGEGIHRVSGHSCYWCHRWIKSGERAHYQSHGDCGQIHCSNCHNQIDSGFSRNRYEWAEYFWWCAGVDLLG